MRKTRAPWVVLKGSTWLATSTRRSHRLVYFDTWREAFDYAFEQTKKEASK